MSQEFSPDELHDKYKTLWIVSWCVLALAVLALAHEALSMVPKDLRLIGAGIAVAVCLITLYPFRSKGRLHLRAAFESGVRRGIALEQERAAVRAAAGENEE
ncbi:hypothetical protein [Streptomyces sp. DSM 40484]|uniref:hypothetical protein n=1 Tax=Streptomyces kroppenstedtii TaxID=3051181 RepID=UPI0028D694EC|nr:hypothetical protein [Streptomyces sp. DSM 40484]